MTVTPISSSVQCLGLDEEELVEREVDFVDIAYDEIPENNYKKEEVCQTYWRDWTSRLGLPGKDLPTRVASVVI